MKNAHISNEDLDRSQSPFVVGHPVEKSIHRKKKEIAKKMKSVENKLKNYTPSDRNITPYEKSHRRHLKMK